MLLMNRRMANCGEGDIEHIFESSPPESYWSFPFGLAQCRMRIGQSCQHFLINDNLVNVS